MLRLVHAIEAVSSLPSSGREVPELGRPEIREVIEGNYRIVYRLRDHTLAVLGRLDTSNLSAGSYQLLLAARDNQNQIIGETCMVSFELK